jgi:hypothetical protein
MTPWRRIAIESAQDFESEGVIETRIEPSPYNIPIAFRAYYLKSAESMRIQFKYLDRDEPVVAVQRSEDLRLVIGQHSKRIIGIEIHFLEVPTTEAVSKALNSASLKNALKRERIESKDENAKENYTMIEKLLFTNSRDIIREVVGSSLHAL